jgi:hypothetical protein
MRERAFSAVNTTRRLSNLHERLCVVAALPLRFTLESLEFSCEIDLEIRSRGRLRVWPPVLGALHSLLLT